MVSGSPVDKGSLLNLITAVPEKRHLKEYQVSTVLRVRNAINTDLVELVSHSNVHKDDILEIIKLRDTLCSRLMEKRYPQEAAQGPAKRVKLEAHSPPTRTDNNSLMRSKLSTQAGSDNQVGEPPRSNFEMIDEDEDEEPGIDQQVLAADILNRSRRQQNFVRAVPNNPRNRATAALIATTEKLLRDFKPSGKNLSVNEILKNNKKSLNKRLIKIIQSGEHVTEDTLESVVRSIAKEILPSTAPQFQHVFQYLVRVANKPKRSNFGAIMYLIIDHHATEGCSANCPRM